MNVNIKNIVFENFNQNNVLQYFKKENDDELIEKYLEITSFLAKKIFFYYGKAYCKCNVVYDFEKQTKKQKVISKLLKILPIDSYEINDSEINLGINNTTDPVFFLLSLVVFENYLKNNKIIVDSYLKIFNRFFEHRNDFCYSGDPLVNKKELEQYFQNIWKYSSDLILLYRDFVEIAIQRAFAKQWIKSYSGKLCIFQDTVDLGFEYEEISRNPSQTKNAICKEFEINETFFDININFGKEHNNKNIIKEQILLIIEKMIYCQSNDELLELFQENLIEIID